MRETVTKFQKHSETSRAAAYEIELSAKTLRGKVFRVIGGSKCGATDEQIQIYLAMNPSTQRPRRVELVEQGLVVDSGRKRKTKSGRQAVVWALREERQ